MYFSSFPVIPYGSTDGTVKNVTNLLRRVAIRTKENQMQPYMIPIMLKMVRLQR